MTCAEFGVGESVTAVVNSRLETGESYDDPIIIGVYTSCPGEIWMEISGKRTNIQCKDVNVLCAQLRRAVVFSRNLPTDSI